MEVEEGIGEEEEDVGALDPSFRRRNPNKVPRSLPFNERPLIRPVGDWSVNL
jgi:hypothetical protein